MQSIRGTVKPIGGEIHMSVGKTMGCVALLSLAAASNCIAQPRPGENCVIVDDAPVTGNLCGSIDGWVEAGTTVIAKQTKWCRTSEGPRSFTYVGEGGIVFKRIGWVPTEYLASISPLKDCP